MDTKYKDFTYYCPTKIYYRVNGAESVGSIIKNDYGFEKVFVVCSSSSIKSKLIDKVISSLKEENIKYLTYTNIIANPDVEDVLKMKEMIVDFKPELILAIGGGSVIDSCKLLAHLYYYDGNPLDFNKRVVKPINALKVATILTISASGSEMSSSCVISDRKTNFKGGFNSDTNYPLFSILDPTLTYTVSLKQIGYGLVDMFSHSFERYYSYSLEIEPSDYLALATMKGIIDVSYLVLKNKEDYQASRAMMLFGSISHNGFTDFGKNKKFIVHPAEHYLSGKYPILAHGQGIALLLIPFLEVNKDNKVIYNKTIQLGKVCFSSSNPTYDDVLKSIKNWLDSLPIASSFDKLDIQISKEDIDIAIKKLKIS